MQRGHNREPCFFAEEDYSSYLHWLGEALGETKCALHAYCTPRVFLQIFKMGQQSQKHNREKEKKIKSIRNWLAVLLMSCISGYAYSDAGQPEKQRSPDAITPQPATTPTADRAQVRSVTRPAGDRAMNDAVPKNYPRPPSAWLSNEKAFYEKLLSNGSFDLLVIPFQVQDYALDQPTRSLMAAQLASALAADQNLRVPDPYLVARALGDGERRFNSDDVYRLGKCRAGA